jgi:hypothetical protein
MRDHHRPASVKGVAQIKIIIPARRCARASRSCWSGAVVRRAGLPACRFEEHPAPSPRLGHSFLPRATTRGKDAARTGSQDGCLTCGWHGAWSSLQQCRDAPRLRYRSPQQSRLGSGLGNGLTPTLSAVLAALPDLTKPPSIQVDAKRDDARSADSLVRALLGQAAFSRTWLSALLAGRVRFL